MGYIKENVFPSEKQTTIFLAIVEIAAIISSSSLQTHLFNRNYLVTEILCGSTTVHNNLILYEYNNFVLCDYFHVMQ